MTDVYYEDMAEAVPPVSLDQQLVLQEAQARIDRRLTELELAEAEGRLADAIKGVPSVEEQFRMLRGLPR